MIGACNPLRYLPQRRTRPAEPDFSEALFRQRERTVDNVKRVYAIVYSFSFTYLLRDIFEFVQAAINAPGKAFEQGLQLRLLMLLIFASTVSVFAFQADKFLDLRYALRPEPPATMPRWNGSDFAIDCISLIVTLIPFTLMSYSYDKDLMNKAGIIPFFLAYALLLFVSLLLLLVVRLKYLLSLITYKPATTVAADEETRYTALTLHWFFVNGIAIVVLMIGFDWLNADHGLCAASMKGPPLWFIELFTFVALLRNYVDFATVWPFLYINKREELPEDLPWFSRGIMGWAMRQPLAHCVTLSDGLVLVISVIVGWIVCPNILHFVTVMHSCP